MPPAPSQSFAGEQTRSLRRRAHQQWTRCSRQAGSAKDDTMMQDESAKPDLFLLDDDQQQFQLFNLKLRLSSSDAHEWLDQREAGYARRYQRQRYSRQQQQQMQQHSPHCLSLEELKMTRNSCWLCGCNWQQDHVSLDCPECDGYALSRPCPSCDGRCQQVWQRNINATHDHHKALWVGQCSLKGAASSSSYCSESDEAESDSSHHSLCN